MEAKELTKWIPEFFDYENRHGHRIHGTMIKPDGWSKNSKKKFPLLIYVYGGPLGTSKSVVDGSYRSESYFFGGYMAKKHGYLSVVIDPRGQSGYGGLFEKANYEQVGKPQVEDLVDGVKYLTENFHVDDKRVAIHGWEFWRLSNPDVSLHRTRCVSCWNGRSRTYRMGKLQCLVYDRNGRSVKTGIPRSEKVFASSTRQKSEG